MRINPNPPNPEWAFETLGLDKLWDIEEREGKWVALGPMEEPIFGAGTRDDLLRILIQESQA